MLQEKIKNQLKEEYKYKTELHAHTSPVSSCGEVSVEDTVRIYKERGYTSIVISNHFMYDYFDRRLGTEDKDEILEYYLKDYHDALIFGEKYGLNVILAAEVRFKNENDNDYLLYGIEEDELYDIYDLLGGNEKDFYDNYVKKGDTKLLFQAHPFRNGLVVMPPEQVDGYEAYNFHPNHNSRPAFAARYAKSVNKMIIIGTDFHEAPHAGLTAIRTKTPLKNSHDVVNVLKSGDFIMEIDGDLIIR